MATSDHTGDRAQPPEKSQRTRSSLVSVSSEVTVRVAPEQIQRGRRIEQRWSLSHAELAKPGETIFDVGQFVKETRQFTEINTKSAHEGRADARLPEGIDGINYLQRRIATYLESLYNKGDQKRCHVALCDLSTQDEQGNITRYGHNLLAVCKGDNPEGANIAIVLHMDIVDAPQDHFPVSLRINHDTGVVTMHGPGICDEKANMALMQQVVSALETEGFRNYNQLRIFINPEEEPLSPASPPLLRDAVRGTAGGTIESEAILAKLPDQANDVRTTRSEVRSVLELMREPADAVLFMESPAIPGEVTESRKGLIRGQAEISGPEAPLGLAALIVDTYKPVYAPLADASTVMDEIAPRGKFAEKITNIKISDLASSPTENIVAKEASCQIEITTQPGAGRDVTTALSTLTNGLGRMVFGNDETPVTARLEPLEGHNPTQGTLRFRLHLDGRAAHSGIEWHVGISATLAQSLAVVGLYRLAGQLPANLEKSLIQPVSADMANTYQQGQATVNIAEIQDQGNGTIRVRTEVRTLTNSIKDRMQDRWSQSLVAGASIVFRPDSSANPYPSGDPPARTELLKEIVQTAGKDLWPKGVNFITKAATSDLNQIGTVNVPALDTFGVIGDGDHSNRARIILSDAARNYYLLRRTIVDICKQVDNLRQT